jgi:hypothetical protein
MEKSAESNPGMAYFYYLFVVILGSFCLLNLTVATVGQNYSRVKEEAEAKKAIKVNLLSFCNVCIFVKTVRMQAVFLELCLHEQDRNRRV